MTKKELEELKTAATEVSIKLRKKPRREIHKFLNSLVPPEARTAYKPQDTTKKIVDALAKLPITKTDDKNWEEGFPHVTHFKEAIALIRRAKALKKHQKFKAKLKAKDEKFLKTQKKKKGKS